MEKIKLYTVVVITQGYYTGYPAIVLSQLINDPHGDESGYHIVVVAVGVPKMFIPADFIKIATRNDFDYTNDGLRLI